MPTWSFGQFLGDISKDSCEMSMRNTFIAMSLAAIILALAGVLVHGPEILIKGLKAGWEMFLNVVPLMMAALVFAGMIQVLVSKEAINQWMGRDSGIKGLLFGGIAGALIPGGPYVYYPVAASFLLSGAELGTVVAFVLAKNLWTLTRLPVEFALMGPYLTLVRFGITLLFPILIGLLANFFFSGYADRVRNQIGGIQGNSEGKASDKER